MTVTTKQVTTLLENVLFESTTMATANTAQWTAIANLQSSTSTVAGLSAYLSTQPEATIAQQVVRYYQGALGRVPSPSEIAFYVNYAETTGGANGGALSAAQIAQGASAVSLSTWNNISGFFANSAEFKADYGLTTSGLTSANEAIVITGFYNNILHRAPSAAEIAFYQNALDNGGATTTTLVQFFANSPEYQASANTQIQTNLASAGVTAVNTVNAGGNPLTSTAPIGPNSGATPTVINLTTGVDTVTGGSGPTTFNATIGNTSAANDTLTALDTITGGSGTNVLNITDLNGSGANHTASSVTVSGVQTINWTAAGGINETLTGADGTFTGVTAFHVVKSAGTDVVTVGNGTAVSVNDSSTGGAGTVNVTATDSAVTVNAADAVTDNGGSSVTISTSAGAVTVGGTTAPTGAITVTDSNIGTNTIAIDGGTTASVTATQTATGGTITIGANTAPTGAITVVDNVNSSTGGTSATGAGINVHGGTVDAVTVNLTQKIVTASSTAGTSLANATATANTVNLYGASGTTSVAVTETAAQAAKNTVTAQAGVTESNTVTFSALGAGQAITLAGLTFTNGSTALTVAQTAAIFANLSNGALAGSSTLGTYSGTFTGWSTGAVGGTSTAPTVTFTSSTASSNVTDLAAATGTGAAAATLGTETQGSAATTAAAGQVGIANGAVNVYGVDNTHDAAAIATVSLSGYAGSTIMDDALTTLSLTNGAGTVTVTNTKATTLGLTLNNVSGALTDASGTYTTLNITTAGKDSTLATTAAGVTTLTVSGTNAVDMSGATLAAVKTVTVSGSAGLKLAAADAGTLTDINASATSGAVTASIDGTKATYEGGSGADTLSVTTTTVTKAISLGAGNDWVDLTALSTASAPGATIDGGAGTDTVKLTAAEAATFSGSTSFATKVVNFEVVELSADAAGATINLANLGYNTVKSDGETGTLNLQGWTSGGTLTVAGDATGGTFAITSTNFTSSNASSNVFNLALSASASQNDGTVNVSNVATLNISATDTNTTHSAGTITHTLTLVDTSATSIKITGNANVILTNTGNTAVSSIDASALQGGLTVTAAGTVAETIKGGTMANTLAAATGATTADVLIGGAGADSITANKGLDTLTGGGGNDIFHIVASANANSYATITDAHAGNMIEFAAGSTFTAAKISLASTAVFQDYANYAIGNTASGTVSWFQYNGDTYVVENASASTTAFQNGTDSIVKLTGLHDLSTAAFNSGVHGVLLNS